MAILFDGSAGPNLDLRLFEIDVLADDRVVLLQHELVRCALAVLRRRVEEAGVGGRHEPDQLASRFTLLGHGSVLREERTYAMGPADRGRVWVGLAWGSGSSPVAPSVGSREEPSSAPANPGNVVDLRFARRPSI